MSINTKKPDKRFYVKNMLSLNVRGGNIWLVVLIHLDL